MPELQVSGARMLDNEDGAPWQQEMRIAFFPTGKTDDEGKPIGETALVKIAKGGIVKSVRKMVQLDREKGHVCNIPVYNYGTKKYDEQLIVTTTGYDYLNLFAGIRIIQPRTLINEDGNEVCNPFPYRDAHGFVKALKVNMVGVGRLPNGNWAVRDITINYDLATYFAQDVFAKWKGKADAKPKDWGEMVGFVPEEIKKDPSKKIVPIPGGSFLIVDLTSSEAIKCQGEHITRTKFIERIAVSICCRNILKKFLAVSKVGPDLLVGVVGWVDIDRDEVALGRILTSARDGAAMIDGEPVTFDNAPIDPQDEQETVAALAGDFDEDDRAPFDAAEASESPPAEAASPKAEGSAIECKNMRQVIRDLYGQMPPKAAVVRLKELSGGTLESVAGIADLPRLKGIAAGLKYGREFDRIESEAFQASATKEWPPDMPDDDSPESRAACSKSRQAIAELSGKLPLHTVKGILKSCKCETVALLESNTDPIHLGMIEAEMADAVELQKQESPGGGRASAEPKGD